MLLSEVTTGLQDAEQGSLVKHGSTRPGSVIRLRSKWQVVPPTNFLHYLSMLWYFHGVIFPYPTIDGK
jgi:hypothetical protein